MPVLADMRGSLALLPFNRCFPRALRSIKIQVIPHLRSCLPDNILAMPYYGSDDTASDADSTTVQYQPPRRAQHRSRHREPRGSHSDEEEYGDADYHIHPVSRRRGLDDLYNRPPVIRVRRPSPSRSRSRNHGIEHENGRSRRPRTESSPPRPSSSRHASKARLTPSDMDTFYSEEKPYNRELNRSSSAEATTSRYGSDYSRGRPSGYQRSETEDMRGTYQRGRVSSLDPSQVRRTLRTTSIQRAAEAEEPRSIRTYSPERDSPATGTSTGMCRSHSSRSTRDLMTRALPPRASRSSIPIWDRDAMYQYYNVRGKDIRLLYLLPGTESMVKCEIIPASLKSHPEYMALSYAWGDSDDTAPIQVNGYRFDVTSSLHGALVALRKRHKHPLLWVDAVCINQQNKEEQSHQVSMMTQIYSQAKSVAIWLGPEADNSEHAISLLRDVSDIAHDPRAMNHLLASRGDQMRFTALVDLFERDYWDRLWVVQEVLNARSVTVYCGNTSLPWRVYVDASDAFKRHEEQLKQYLPSTGNNKVIPLVSQQQFQYSVVLAFKGPASLERLRQEPDAEPISLLSVLCNCRLKLSSEPRDKVFGVLGILPQEFKYNFPPNYSASLREVYTNVVEFLLHATGSFDVICAAIHFPVQRSVTKLPSWVPDWSHVVNVCPLGGIDVFSAAGGTKAAFGFVDRPLRTKLEVSAIYLGRVFRKGTAVDTFLGIEKLLMAFLNWRAEMLRGWPIQNAQIREAFCRTLCLDQLGNWNTSEWMGICYHVFASLIQEWLPYIVLDDELRWYANELNTGVAPDNRQIIIEKNCKEMSGRRYFMTEDGLMGMGTGFLRNGDIVCVPLGCSTPVILREERNGEYRFIGDAYVDGYMYGRAVDELGDGRRELRKYVLC